MVSLTHKNSLNHESGWGFLLCPERESSLRARLVTKSQTIGFSPDSPACGIIGVTTVSILSPTEILSHNKIPFLQRDFLMSHGARRGNSSSIARDGYGYERQTVVFLKSCNDFTLLFDSLSYFFVKKYPSFS